MYYIEKEKQLNVFGEYDVVVAGAGPSGTAAAITAARNGARVLLTEYAGAIGGMSTTGLMSHFTGGVTSKLYSEIMKRSAQNNEGAHHNKITPTIDPEKLKTLYLDMLAEAEVHILLYTLAADAIVENNKVKGIIIENKNGRQAVYAKAVIDGTGDGDIAARSGADYYIGREEDGKMQPSTLMFKVGGVDTDRAILLGSFESMHVTEKGELQELAKTHLPHPAGHVLLYRTTLPGIITCNMTNAIGIDGTDTVSLTTAEITCRSQMKSIVNFLREYVPGFENCYIISSGAMMGIRETRHFIGMYTLTEDDILAARIFDDWVVRGAHFNFDVHSIHGAGLDPTGVQHKFPQPKGYTIPFGCLVPKKIDGLLLSGRNISGTHIAHSNFRVMPICVGIGEAAGAAAALSVKKSCEVRRVNPADIQDRLL